MSDIDDVSQDLTVSLVTGPVGTLKVRAFVDSTEETGIYVEILETHQNGTTPWTVSLSPDTYHVQAKYQDQDPIKTAEIVAGQTTELDFYLTAQEWRLSLNVSSLNVQVGDPVTFSGKLEKKCPDETWHNPNWICAENRQRDDPRHYAVDLMPGHQDAHQTTTDHEGNYSATFPFTISGDFVAKAQAYVPDVGYVKVTNGTIHVEPGPLPEFSAVLNSVINYCDLTPPKLQLKGQCYQDDNPGPSGCHVVAFVEGEQLSPSSSTTANGKFNFYVQYPPEGTHDIQVRVRWFYEATKYLEAWTNKLSYTC